MLKNADEILGPALDQFYVRRQRAFKHINERTGNYWHVFAAHRAQIALELARLADLASGNRLSASGQDLRDYVASEFADLPDLQATYATGEISFARATAEAGSGDIKKGTRFRREANSKTHIPLTEAVYETLADLHIGADALTAGPVAIRAVSVGVPANHPVRTDTTTHGVTVDNAALFDPTIQVTTFTCAGGAAANEDSYIRRFASASAKGLFGPINAAAEFGFFTESGARHMLGYDDVPNGVLKLLVADSSWASSERWVKLVQQSIYDNDLTGFGCQVHALAVRNKVISVAANVTLDDWNYTSDTLEIDEAIRTATRAYFDDRPDWNIWKTRALKNAITRAHPKILKCTDVTVRDVNGSPMSEITNVDYNIEQFHYYLANNAMSLTYVGPT